MVSTIKNRINDAIVGLGVNHGKCPESYEFVDHRRSENPWISKYGDKWMDYASKSPTLKLVRPVSDLITHMAVESTKAMKTSPYQNKALFYHDALSQLTENETVEWMKGSKYDKRTIYDMWIKPEMGCND